MPEAIPVSIRRTTRTLAAIALALALAACGGRAFEYRSQTEIPEGPGLLTGEKGAVVFGGPGITPPGAAAGNPAPAVGGGDNFADFETFREFKRAKEARSAEYREFLDWRAFKAYRDSQKKRQ